MEGRPSRLAAQVAVVLMGVAWGMDTISRCAAWRSSIYLTDPLVIIAAALLLTQVPRLQAHPRAFQIGALLMAAHLVVGLSGPVRETFRSSKPLDLCRGRFVYTSRIESYSFCPRLADHQGEAQSAAQYAAQHPDLVDFAN